jgi:hypothetical protein
MMKSRIRWLGHVARIGKIRNPYMIFILKPEGKNPLGGRKSRWAGNIEMDHSQIGQGGINWIHLSQDRNQWQALVNTVMNLRGSIKFLEVPEWLSNWQFLKKDSSPWSWLLMVG